MELAEPSVRKKNPNKDGGGLFFRPIQESAREFASGTAGKLLVVSDAISYRAVAFLASFPRTVSVVLEGDALPLFSMPDGVGGVLAAGGEDTLLAARFYADLIKAPCLLVPSDATLRGATEEHGTPSVDGERRETALAAGTVACDVSLLTGSLADACAELLLARLSLFETAALAEFRGEKPPSVYEEAYGLLLRAAPPFTPETLVRTHASLRGAEARGLPVGEGFVLRSLCGGDLPSMGAFTQLFALYAAFFSKGRPRRYAVPDYAARAARAGTVNAAYVPTAEEYASRALALERMRGRRMQEAEILSRASSAYRREARSYLGREPHFPQGKDLLRALPEHCPHGLSAIIRDFGLMEW